MCHVLGLYQCIGLSASNGADLSQETMLYVYAHAHIHACVRVGREMGVTGRTHTCYTLYTLLLFAVYCEERLGEEFSVPFFFFLNNTVKPHVYSVSWVTYGESLT